MVSSTAAGTQLGGWLARPTHSQGTTPHWPSSRLRTRPGAVARPTGSTSDLQAVPWSWRGPLGDGLGLKGAGSQTPRTHSSSSWFPLVHALSECSSQYVHVIPLRNPTIDPTGSTTSCSRATPQTPVQNPREVTSRSVGDGRSDPSGLLGRGACSSMRGGRRRSEKRSGGCV